MLVDFDVEPHVFGADAVRAVVDYKWRTFGRSILMTEFVLHVLVLILNTFLSAEFHDPNSLLFDNRIVQINTGGDERSLKTNILQMTMALFLGRILCYELINYSNAGTIWQWASTIWTWVDISAIVFYILALFTNSFSWTSRAASILTLTLWTKVFYYMKGFGPTSSMVQVSVRVFDAFLQEGRCDKIRSRILFIVTIINHYLSRHNGNIYI